MSIAMLRWHERESAALLDKLKLLIAFTIVLVLTTFWALLAQACDEQELDATQGVTGIGLNLHYLKGYLTHTGSILASPLSWSQNSWLTFAGLVIVTTALASEEDDIQRWIQRNRTRTTDRISRTVKPLGDKTVMLGSIAGLYAYAKLFNDDHAKATSLIALESTAITALFTETIKHLTHKHRPGPTHIDDASWDGPSFKKENLSFPSGHAAHSFAIATVVASQYRDRGFVPPLAYTAATLCALSRLNDNKHWISDVVIGAALGHFTAKAVFELHAKETTNLNITPFFEDGMGLMLSFRF